MAVKKHHHAAPIVLAAFALLALGAVALNHFTSGQYAAVRALTTRVIDVHPTSNGLAQVTEHRQPSLNSGPDWTQAGSETALNLSLQ